MRRCIDCKYFSNGGLMALLMSPFKREWAKCRHPAAFRYSTASDRLIAGWGPETSVLQFYCSTMRNPVGECAPEGHLFEPK